VYDVFSDKNVRIKGYIIRAYVIMFFFTCKYVYMHCKCPHTIRIVYFVLAYT